MEFNVQLQLAGLLEWMHQQMNACHGKTAVIGITLVPLLSGLFG